MKPGNLIFLVLMALLLVACVTVKPSTRVTSGVGWYTVKVTDTLYSIAWRYSLDTKQLAHWNGIDINALIHPGQRLKLVKPVKQNIATTKPAPTGSTSSTTASTTSSTGTKTSTKTKPVQSSFKNPTKWIWPTKGKPLNTFSANKLDRRGIDIAGSFGQDVLSVADGRVVYSGNGLSGYGNLIIIKHSETYLSAYAYCQERLVTEGMTVKSGKLVARMGRKDNIAKLHFEIRRNGKPVDPLKYLSGK